MTTITPAGHQQAIANKAHTAEPKSELERILQEFRRAPLQEARTSMDLYSLAQSRLTGIGKISVPEAYSVILNTEPAELDGIFLSAAYALAEENVIRHDIDVSYSYIGYGLPRDKLLVTIGKTGDWVGFCAYGTIVNLGPSGGHFGVGHKGISLNAGTVGDKCGVPDQNGVSLSITNPQRMAVLNHSDRFEIRSSFPPGLNTYLEELAETCKGTLEDIHTRYGQTPGTTIQDDIRRLLSEVYI